MSATSYRVVLDRVYSPDDGGWYAQETDLDNGKSRVTRRIYRNRVSLDKALASDRPSIWEDWS